MLGFNKYVIPFQRSSQKLPFNVAGLDTIKYTDRDFERLASDAVDQAIRETEQDAPPSFSPDQVLGMFLLARKALITPLDEGGDRTLYNLGAPLGFNLLNDFTGLEYIYLGNFTALRPEAILWRVKLLAEIVAGRRATIHDRVQAGVATLAQATLADALLSRVRVWLVVTADEDKAKVEQGLAGDPLSVEVYSLADVSSELEKLQRSGG